jgi:hypothetical protein
MPVVKGIIGLGVGEVTNGAAGKRTAKPKGKARNLSAPGPFDWLDSWRLIAVTGKQQREEENRNGITPQNECGIHYRSSIASIARSIASPGSLSYPQSMHWSWSNSSCSQQIAQPNSSQGVVCSGTGGITVSFMFLSSKNYFVATVVPLTVRACRTSSSLSNSTIQYVLCPNVTEYAGTTCLRNANCLKDMQDWLDRLGGLGNVGCN